MTFQKPIYFYHLKIQKRLDDCCKNRYYNVCLVLDDTEKNCTGKKSHKTSYKYILIFQILGTATGWIGDLTDYWFGEPYESDFILWEVTQENVKKVELEFRDTQHAQITDLEISYCQN